MDKLKKKFTYKLVLIIDAILIAIYLSATILFNVKKIDDNTYGILSIFSSGIAVVLVIIRVMISIMIFSNNIHQMDSSEYQEKLMKAMYKVNNGGDINDLDSIVNDYLILISKRYKGSIDSFKISSSNYLDIQVNGEAVSLYRTSDDSEDYKEAYYELEALMNDGITLVMIENALLNKEYKN